MKLRAKFNLVLLIIFTAGLLLSGFVTYGMLHANARAEVLRNAELMMDTAIAIRGYTVNQVRPHLSEQLEQTFLPQSVPAYAATETLDSLRKKYPQYSYKEATVNPTNPRDRARSWEHVIIDRFRHDAARQQIVGERNIASGRLLYMARPIRITKEACLSCHSTPESAPASMLAVYGDENGFGWKLNEIVGAQLVTVPMSVPIAKANEAFFAFMGSLAAVFLVLFIALNLMLGRLIITPIARLSRAADEISVGKLDIAEFTRAGKDEVAVLATSFNRMRRSLSKAMDMVQA